MPTTAEQPAETRSAKRPSTLSDETVPEKQRRQGSRSSTRSELTHGSERLNGDAESRGGRLKKVKVGAVLAALAALAAIAGQVHTWWISETSPAPPKVQIDLASSRFNPLGDDPSDEYVRLVNNGDDPVALVGWVLRDASRDVNKLPNFTLHPGEAVDVHPGKGTDSASDLFGKEGRAVWNNSGDTVTLNDAKGNMIDSQSYASLKPVSNGRTTERPTPTAGKCDPNYKGACVPPFPPDLNCPDLRDLGLELPVEVVRSDPHGLDGDGDGLGCD